MAYQKIFFCNALTVVFLLQLFLDKNKKEL